MAEEKKELTKEELAKQLNEMNQQEVQNYLAEIGKLDEKFGFQIAMVPCQGCGGRGHIVQVVPKEIK